MFCPNCKKAMMPCKRMDEVYYFCTNCGCEVESTSSSDDTKWVDNYEKYQNNVASMNTETYTTANGLTAIAR